jgi:phosphatidylserine decarboxylase
VFSGACAGLYLAPYIAYTARVSGEARGTTDVTYRKGATFRVNLISIRTRVARGAAKWAPAGLFSTLVGLSARTPMPRVLRRPLLGAFARAVGADLAEAEHELAHYPSLGDFFARKLREGARSIARDRDAVVAPCDGLVAAAGVVEDGTLVQAKGKTFSLGRLLADEDLAEQLLGGSYAVIYLSPRDYHRVHSPVTAHLEGYHYLPGARWPVSPPFVERVEGLLAKNERVVMNLLTDVGPAAVVMVSATGVGNIWLEHLGSDTRVFRAVGERRRIELPDPPLVERGDELGAFLLGSTVVVVLPPGGSSLDLQPGDVVRCGQRIGTFEGGQGT